MEKSGNMFFGTYSHSLDTKNRLVIPRKMRDQFGEKLFIMKGFDGALSIYQEAAFDALVKEFNELPFNKKGSRDYLRIQLASVSELEFDRLGRVVIPASLLSQYGIGKEVLIIGVGDHIELWDENKYREYAKNVEKTFENIAEQIKAED